MTSVRRSKSSDTSFTRMQRGSSASAVTNVVIPDLDDEEGVAIAKTTSPVYVLPLLALSTLFLMGDQNMMAPNLTAAAAEFGFNAAQRDQNLGANLALAYFIVGAPFSIIIGYLADRLNRINLLCFIILLGEIPNVCMVFVTAYWQLFLLRAITGVASGGLLSLMYSLMGDLFVSERRAFASSMISIMAGAGIVLGQILSGNVGPVLNWKYPFLIVALPNILLAFVIYMVIKEPQRGSAEKSKINYDEHYDQTLDWKSFKNIFVIPSNRLAFLQALPGTIPWSLAIFSFSMKESGFINVFLNDYINTDRAFGPNTASLAITSFGIGAVVSVIGGGAIGQILYNRSRKMFCIFIGVMTLLGVPAVWMVVYLNYNVAGLISVCFTLGLVTSVTGANVRTVVVNVNTPETRGTAFSFFTVLDCIGKGGGPLIVALLVSATGNRQLGFVLSALPWVFAGACHFLLCFYLEADEEKMNNRFVKKLSSPRSPSKTNDNRKSPLLNEVFDRETPHDSPVVTIISNPLSVDDKIKI